ncbi:hypothetical protein [Pseudobacteriovorax antillogorgiicola]|uniref:Uncharacterized protein n=1 Tax=Pseudobacteriovorax antillogorgiicola TaxID=1513793 RepID=A0A1Y6CEE8_9BACT|nr:hypothetical protein [Pseudobacteriovorax antillogorgiicola]TCS51789.1 hypothetical protein EDD56_110174 [Pseudobacteriovorax antillogorgiicola]SMF50001.1 hypothetical protein SAMN06296036_115143 [Pseudobacteriovorax antillogorgiicola]
MKLSRSYIGILIMFFGLMSLQGCALFGGGDQQQEEFESFDDQEDEDDEQEGDEDQQEQEDDNFENQEENQQSQESNQFNEANSLGMEGMDNTANDTLSNLTNTDPVISDDLGAGTGIPGADNSIGMDNMANSAMGMGNEMEDLNAMMNSMNTGNAAGGVPMDPGMGANMGMDAGMMNNAAGATAAPAAPAMAPPGGARVYFVMAGGAELKDTPNGTTIQNLPQGDPCLVTVEGDWANVVNRGYILLSQLSMSPVGREMGQPGWN